MCFSFRTYFIINPQDDFIQCMINNENFLLMSVKFIYSRGIMPTVLSGPAFRIIKTKIYQDLAFI